MGVVLSERFAGYRHYAPIDARALRQYRVFEPLGFFGVEPTTEGALTFLKTGTAILSEGNNALWVTVQGQFTDPRQRPVLIRPGVGHLLRRLQGAVVLPLAIEYPFWQERYPEALAYFGAPMVVDRGREHPVEAWMSRIEVGLTAAMDALALEAQSQGADRFDTVAGGSVGVGGVYDLWRRLKAALAGRRFLQGHAEAVTEGAS